MRAERLRANGAYLRPEAFQARKEALVAKDIGALHEQVRIYNDDDDYDPRRSVFERGICARAPIIPPHPACLLTSSSSFSSHTQLYTQNLPGAVNPMANPGGMMEMVKGQAYFGMTQMGMVQVCFRLE